MRATFAIPGDLATRTGGYAYARALIGAAPEQGLTLEPLALPGGFPFPSGAELDETARLLAGAAGPVLIDGLALGALPVTVLREVSGPLVGLCHHPLALETGLEPAEAARLRDSEAAALALCAHVVVPSVGTARAVTELGVAEGRITVAPPGLEPAEPAPRRGDPPVILSVGALVPRKGHDILIAALHGLAELTWRAVVAGPERDPGWAARLREMSAGLEGRLTLAGPQDAAGLDRLYAGADIFCLPSRHEGYGMVFAEAMMRGLPLVACRAGAVPELVPSQAGLLVPPDDPGALAAALSRLLRAPGDAAGMGAAGRAHALSLPGWAETAARVAHALREAGA